MQVIRVRNYALMSYNIGIKSECLTTRLYYANLMQQSPEGTVWQATLPVPFTLDQGGRSAHAEEELAKVKDSSPATDQSISIALTASERGARGKYVLPEFMIQVDVGG